jgi:hypothetical protein
MRALITSLLTATVALPALGQSTADLAPQAPASTVWTADARLGAPVDASLLPAGLATAPDAAPVMARARSRNALGPVIPGAIGAVLGGWVGYLASQVARSDWDKENNGQFTGYRMSFTAGGAAIGAITGVVLGRHLGGSGGAPTPRMMRDHNPNLISAQEISNAHAQNALDLIQSLRPRWLETRGINTNAEGGGGSASGMGATMDVNIHGGVSPIKVYIDNTFLGDISVLRNIPNGSFSEVRYFDAAQATYRWGQGHMGGAIEFSTAPIQ